MTQGSSTIQNNINQYLQDNGIEGVNYTNPQVAAIMQKGGISYNESAKSGSRNKEEPVDIGLFKTDIAQAHHFVVQIEKPNGKNMFSLQSPSPKFGKFLPVKTINLTYSSYENMSIPVSIFGDFPLLNRKRVSTIALTCYDTDDNQLEREVRLWENSCFPKNRYVAYMEDIARKFTYTGYNVKGKSTFTASFYVIPSGAVSVSRDYSTNDAKMISFNLVCVGDGSSCAVGNPSPKQVIQQSYEFIPTRGEDDRMSGDNQVINRGYNDLINDGEVVGTPYNPSGSDVIS